MISFFESTDLKSRFEINKRNENILVICFILLYVFLNLAYGILDNATWDDDCPGRIYNTMIAFEKPEHFISVWNRPLFVLLFAPLLPIGINVVFISMILISATSAYFLYLGAKKKKMQNAFMVVPLLLFQTFYFSVSRNAETEPLAVALLCFGFYFLVHKKWLGFAIVGGLLPLARLELAVFLAIWAFYLLKDKQYKYILFLGLPTLLWNIAGGFIADDFLYLVSNTIGRDNSSNRYGHKSFVHYFQRYIYMIGPVIYVFFLLGLIYKTHKKRVDSFVYLQFVFGFMLYVAFSWKFNIGNSAGFLRNLIPLAPLTALIALDGYNFMWNVIISFDRKSGLIAFPTPERDYIVLTDQEFNVLNSKKRRQYLSEVRSWNESAGKRDKEKDLFNQKNKRSRLQNILILAFLMLALVSSVYLYHSLEMHSHHDFLTKNNYTNLQITGGVLLSVIGLFFIIRFSLFKQNQIYIFGILIALGAVGFTAITEPPNENMNPERETMKEVSDFYTSSYLKDQLTFVNHIWFFWANGLDRYDSLKYKNVTKANLNDALPNEVLIYETHYSHRLAGDVPLKWFKNHKEWVMLSRFISSNNGFQCIIFQKTDASKKSILASHNKFLKNHLNNTSGFYQRGLYHHKNKQFKLATKDYSESLKDTSSFFLSSKYFNRGLSYFSSRKYHLAIKDFKTNFALKNTKSDALFNISSCFTNINEFDSAIFYLDKTIALRPKYQKAFINKGVLLRKKNKKEEALKAFNQVININPKNENALLQRAQINFESRNWKPCVKDLNSVIKLKPNTSNNYFIRGLCNKELKQMKLCCKDWSKAKFLGDKRAQQYLNFYCR